MFEQADHWFRRAQASLLDTIPCGQGCSACCVGIFPITRLDALELQRGLEALPSMQRDAIVTRARTQVAALEAAYPHLQSQPALGSRDDRTIDDMVAHFSDVPCPALAQDGTCGLYTSRPITCRTMGIPSESDGMIYGACAVQTAVPIIRLSPSFRAEADRLAEYEAVALSILNRNQPDSEDELLLPYGFVPSRA
ncbi:MAG: YkgJ family cysteine cluster protein [Nitrospira sp.]|nr:YkgJ family cysteine cluster protein [Nitrospira sp.]